MGDGKNGAHGSNPKNNEGEGLIADDKLRKEKKQIHSGLNGEIDDNEEENTLQKGFDRTSRGYKGG
jgi:hypothetical protein